MFDSSLLQNNPSKAVNNYTWKPKLKFYIYLKKTGTLGWMSHLWVWLTVNLIGCAFLSILCLLSSSSTVLYVQYAAVVSCFFCVTPIMFAQLMLKEGEQGEYTVWIILQPKDFSLSWLMLVCLCVSNRSSQSQRQERGAGVELPRLIYSGKQHCGLSERKGSWQTDSALPQATYCRLHHQGEQKHKRMKENIIVNLCCVVVLSLIVEMLSWI